MSAAMRLPLANPSRLTVGHGRRAEFGVGAGELSPSGRRVGFTHLESTAEGVICRGARVARATLARMTSSDGPDAVSSVVTVSDPGELIAATPALLGFPPRSSLVAMALGGASGVRLGLTLRIDLPPPEHITAAAESVVHGILLDEPLGVVIVVVGAGGDAGPPAIELVERVVAGLESRAVDVPLALWTESIDGGSRWSCYDACACTGIIPRPEETPLVVAAIAEGRVVRGDRADLARLVAPADEDRIRRREAMLVATIDGAVDGAVDGAADGAESGERDAGDGVIEGIATLDAALDAVAEFAANATSGDAAAGGAAEDGIVLDDEQVLALTWALATPAVRDVAIAACTGSRPAAAEALWTALVRETPDPEAAEPAALLALSALLRGDGALANVALDRAESAWPGHSLTATLRDLARAGTRPSELRACLTGCPPPFPAQR
jgi:hypothetical protein